MPILRTINNFKFKLIAFSNYSNIHNNSRISQLETKF